MGQLFDDLNRVELLPNPLAEAAREMLVEAETNGLHTTAPETITLVEATLSHLGRTWVAEYIQAGAFDPAVNRDLFDILSRNVSVGQWVGLCRRLRQLFVDQDRETVIAGLSLQDYGQMGDDQHLVAQLISYRNSFSHGSMSAVAEDIQHHCNLLEEMLANLPALIEQPMQFVSAENRVTILANGQWERATSELEQTQPLQPVILSPDGSKRLEFYPLLYISEGESGYHLEHTDPKDQAHPVSLLFEREVLKVWHQRYQYEREGHLDFNQQIQQKSTGWLPAEIKSDLQQSIGDPAQHLILVQAHPGCRKAEAVAGLLSPDSGLVEEERFANVSVFDVMPGHLSQSGITFAAFILRRIEAALDLEDGHFELPVDQLDQVLLQACAQLKAAGKEILIGIENLHLGDQAYRREPWTVMDVYRLISEEAVTVVATIHYGAVSTPLFFDRVIDWPVLDSQEVEVDDLQAVMQQLCSSSPEVKTQILETLSQSQEAMNCFTICDALESRQDGQQIFEANIEREIWDLQPLLKKEQQEATEEKSWALFSPQVAELLNPTETAQ